MPSVEHAAAMALMIGSLSLVFLWQGLKAVKLCFFLSFGLVNATSNFEAKINSNFFELWLQNALSQTLIGNTKLV